MDSRFREDKALRLARAVKLVQAGDVNAYEEIYACCDGALRAFIGRRYGHRGQDFVEEVAVRTHEYALSRLSEYNAAKASPQTWLNWQSRSVAGQVMRERYGPRLVQYEESVHEAWAVTATGPAEVYEEERLSRVLIEEVERLSDRSRQSVVLHDRDGLTYAEAAEASGLSVMQVRYRRRRALTLLKHRLLRRGVRPVAIDFTPAPVWYGRD